MDSMGSPDSLCESWSWHQRGRLPAWVVSLAVHLTAFTALGLTVKTAPQGAASEPTRIGGIVLVARQSGNSEYFSDNVGGQAAGNSLPSPQVAQPLLTVDLPQPAAAGPQLPAPQDPGGAAPVASSGPPSTSAAAARFPGRGSVPAVETQVFGVRGRGTRFVYVFDRSSSMEGGPLIAAKRELIASLQSLQSVHQFQIIFYNQEPRLMTLRGPSTGMVFGDEPGKRLAASFVGGIFADGATDHMQALNMALRMRPDVVFFLTDADEPQLRADDLQRVRQLNQGTSINAIEFGLGPPKPSLNFLQQLAAENGGQHAYVDITRLAR
jgi:hypothetical protein